MWEQSCEYVKSILEHRLWLKMGLPQKYADIRAEALRLGVVSGPREWDDYSWVIRPGNWGQKGLATLAITYMDRKTGERKNLDLAIQLAPQEAVWEPHWYWSNGALRLGQSDVNYAHMMALMAFDAHQQGSPWPRRYKDIPTAVRSSEFDKTGASSYMEICFDQHEYGYPAIVVHSLRTGTYYVYPADGPTSPIPPKIVRGRPQ